MDTGDLDDVANEIENEVTGVAEEVKKETEEREIPERLEWEEFFEMWESSPFVFVEKALAGAKKDFEEPILQSRIIPAVAYPIYWYLAPYLKVGTGEMIPEPFKPLAGSLMVFGMAIIKKMRETSNREVSTNEGVGAP